MSIELSYVQVDSKHSVYKLLEVVVVVVVVDAEAEHFGTLLFESMVDTQAENNI